jgi:vitamin B12 transporter
VAWRLTALALFCASAQCSRAAAQPSAAPLEGAYGATALVVRPLASTNREDPSASGSEVDARAPLAAQASVSDVLLEVPGARPWRTGATGSFAGASLRGAELEHTAVLFGEIPLSSADATAFDLSTVPLSVLDRVTVYRGGAPAWLGQGAIGGVLQLEPRSAVGGTLSATASAGSFGTYGLSAESAVVPRSPRAPSLLGAVGVLGSSGDFKYVFDNKTVFDASDDYATRRKNADLVDGHGLLHLRQPLGDGALEVLLLGFERAAGEPGAPADPANRARRNLTRGLLGASYTFSRQDARGQRVLRLQALAAGSFERSRLNDRFAEVNPAAASLADDLSARGFGRLAGSVSLADFLELTLVGSAQREARLPDDPLRRIATPDSGRTSLAGVVETNLHGALAGHRLELRPSLRLEHSSAHLYAERFGGITTNQLSATLPTYRLALALELLSELTLSASVASGARVPSMLELFGDGALILGNSVLRPEHSTSYELGLVELAHTSQLELSAELRGFALDIDDQVVFIRNSFSQLVAQNLAKSRIRGLEAGARARFGPHLWCNAATTLLDTEGKPGRRLPNRPSVIAFLQPGVTWRSLGVFDALHVFVESNFVGSSYDEPDNQTPQKPSQLFVGAGTALAFLDSHAELRVTLNDAFDRGGRDLRGFPLPGRTVMTSLTYRESTK